jgi:hypothetical protein
VIEEIAEVDETVTPNNHQLAFTAFTWDDVTESDETVTPNNHKVAFAAFTWNDVARA